jgi:hypothetical protein
VSNIWTGGGRAAPSLISVPFFFLFRKDSRHDIPVTLFVTEQSASVQVKKEDKEWKRRVPLYPSSHFPLAPHMDGILHTLNQRDFFAYLEWPERIQDCATCIIAKNTKPKVHRET